MTLGTIRARTRALIQETTPRRWTDARVDEAINNRYWEGADRLNRIRPGYFDTGAFIGLVAGTASYARPFFKPVRGYYRRASDGTYVECRHYSFDATTPGAEHDISRLVLPTVFTVVELGAVIIVYPTPTATEANGLKVIADSLIALTNDDDVPRLKTELHWRMASGAAAELLADDPTYPEKAKAKLEYDWTYIFGPEPDALKRLCRIYPERRMGQITMEPPTNILDNGRHRRLLNGGTTIIS